MRSSSSKSSSSSPSSSSACSEQTHRQTGCPEGHVVLHPHLGPQSLGRRLSLPPPLPPPRLLAPYLLQGPLLKQQMDPLSRRIQPPKAWARLRPAVLPGGQQHQSS